MATSKSSIKSKRHDPMQDKENIPPVYGISNTSLGKPTPNEFEAFFLRACKSLDVVENVEVYKMVQEEFIILSQRNKIDKKSKKLSSDSEFNPAKEDSKHKINQASKDRLSLKLKQETSRSKQDTTQSKQEISRSKQDTTQSKQEISRSKQDTTQSKQETSRSKQDTMQSKQETSRSKQDTTQSKQEISRSKQETSQSKQAIESKMLHKVTCGDDKTIRLYTFYDTQDLLVELSIVARIFKCCNIMKIINQCIPFHSKLYKFIVKKCKMSQEILYDIGQLLPYSNITELCLEDVYVLQNNFYVLLNETSQIKRLALNRCRINDLVLQEMLPRIDIGGPAAKTLQILELSTNFITDIGASMIGDILRRNRTLLHLNLTGNKITDEGAVHILNTLMDFKVTESEIFDKRLRHREYINKREEVFAQCYAEQLKKVDQTISSRSKTAASSSAASTPKSIAHRRKLKSVSPKPRKSSKTKKSSFNIYYEASNQMADQIMGGRFTDVYDSSNITFEADQVFCLGNLKLCSLNFAYNNLEYFSLKRLSDVLKYQNGMPKLEDWTGLLRVVMDGNNIPHESTEFEEVAMLLSQAVRNLSTEKNNQYIISKNNQKKKLSIKEDSIKLRI